METSNDALIRSYSALSNAHFSGRDASAILGVSYYSLRRRVGGYRRFAHLTNADLDRMVAAVLRETGMIGVESVRARMLSRGMLVQRSHIRAAVQRVDSAGAARRRRRCLRRRIYHVPYGNFLWHVDGWLKLVR
jgi:hypothetical protein